MQMYVWNGKPMFLSSQWQSVDYYLIAYHVEA
jgi:hypothetical protein